MIPFSGPRHEDDFPHFDDIPSLGEFDEYDLDVSSQAWDKISITDLFTMDGNCFDCSPLVEHWPSSSTITFVCSNGTVVVDEEFVCKVSEKLMMYLRLDPHQAQIRYIYAYDADSASLQMLLSIAHYIVRPESKDVETTMLKTYRLAERWEMPYVCDALDWVVALAHDWVLYRNLWRIAEMTEEEYLKRQRILEDAQAALQKCRKD
ncbi:hypothetical protein CTRI78_v002888 [Colletotrichum trifolii]|uniref:Uncharacterized protein n=1 Tax=Colletotrichum trifolii TaxID=5466 RepID=A0A4R8RWZ1_COLTR|nr:hypothetical protein CTRI78_v002888 [Colletotrichum trifolii]